MSHRDNLRNPRDIDNMRYFTPELVRKLNSSDSATVDEATELWEEAILSYQKHLRKLHREMPFGLQPITKLSLHDWNLVAITVGEDGAGRKGGTVLLAVEENGSLIFLWYLLNHKMRRNDSPEGWPFTADSIEALRRGGLQQRRSEVIRPPDTFQRWIDACDSVLKVQRHAGEAGPPYVPLRFDADRVTVSGHPASGVPGCDLIRVPPDRLRKAPH